MCAFIHYVSFKVYLHYYWFGFLSYSLIAGSIFDVNVVDFVLSRLGFDRLALLAVLYYGVYIYYFDNPREIIVLTLINILISIKSFPVV